MGKKSFILYSDMQEHVDLLSDEQTGILLKGLLRYSNTGEPMETKDIGIKMLFSVLRSQIDRDSRKYEKIVEKRKQSGKMGGLAKAKQTVANVANAKDAKQSVANPSKRKQTVANVADNDTVTVTDTDINIIYGESTDSPTALSFENIWSLYGKKGNKKTSERKWSKLSATAKEKALSYIPAYVESTQDKQYRKNLETFLNQEVWNDELSGNNNVNQQTNETKYKFID